MSERHPKLLLEDILESAERIVLYTELLTFKYFTADSKTVDAVLRNFGIIGEATNRLPEEFKDNNPDIGWFRILGFRNRIIHNYFWH